jgi:hypothetical protein
VTQDNQASVILGRELHYLRKVEVCNDQTAIDLATGFSDERILGALEGWRTTEMKCDSPASRM